MSAVFQQWHCMDSLMQGNRLNIKCSHAQEMSLNNQLHARSTIQQHMQLPLDCNVHITPKLSWQHKFSTSSTKQSLGGSVGSCCWEPVAQNATSRVHPPSVFFEHCNKCCQRQWLGHDVHAQAANSKKSHSVGLCVASTRTTSTKLMPPDALRLLCLLFFEGAGFGSFCLLLPKSITMHNVSVDEFWAGPTEYNWRLL